MQFDELVKQILEAKEAPKGKHYDSAGRLKKGDADSDGRGGPKYRSDPTYNNPNDPEDEEKQKGEKIISKKDRELYTERYQNGQKKFEVFMKNGMKDGLENTWYEDGKKSSEGTYKNGKEDGLWTWWYEDGKKSIEGTYKDGKEDGLWTWWYENGQKEVEATYKDGKITSRKDWNEDGSAY